MKRNVHREIRIGKNFFFLPNIRIIIKKQDTVVLQFGLTQSDKNSQLLKKNKIRLR